jgi:hypothetical protein
MTSIIPVFRELLQNSDDAEARSVEIRFETEAYLSRGNGDDLQPEKAEREDILDLKSVVACGFIAFTLGQLLLKHTIIRIDPPMDVQE